jgi:hypothetical protein
MISVEKRKEGKAKIKENGRQRMQNFPAHMYRKRKHKHMKKTKHTILNSDKTNLA